MYYANYLLKNPAYGRHQISLLMRIVALILFFPLASPKGLIGFIYYIFISPPLFLANKKTKIFFYTLTIFLTQSLVLKIVAYFMSEDHSLTDHLTEQTRTNTSQPWAMNGMFCKRCGIGEISKHYEVGHGSVPYRPLF